MVKEHAPGTFCWVDLGTTDAEGAKKFYTGLFGWEAVDRSPDLGMVYSGSL
jgi:predicted enzyme related to lactoylglutathione lyase